MSQTYVVFAVINAFMVPCVYFFFVSDVPATRLPIAMTDNQLHSPKQPAALSKKWTRSSTKSTASKASSLLSRLPARCRDATARMASYSSITTRQKKRGESRSVEEARSLRKTLVRRSSAAMTKKRSKMWRRAMSSGEVCKDAGRGLWNNGSDEVDHNLCVHQAVVTVDLLGICR